MSQATVHRYTLTAAGKLSVPSPYYLGPVSMAGRLQRR